MDDPKKTKVVTVRLSERTYAVIERLARADRRKLASYVGLILDDWVADREAGKAKHGSAKASR
jgi:hypothetical protein